MKKSKFNEQQIAYAPRQVESGHPLRMFMSRRSRPVGR